MMGVSYTGELLTGPLFKTPVGCFEIETNIRIDTVPEVAVLRTSLLCKDLAVVYKIATD
jgi:hypothetical protein